VRCTRCCSCNNRCLIGTSRTARGSLSRSLIDRERYSTRTPEWKQESLAFSEDADGPSWELTQLLCQAAATTYDCYHDGSFDSGMQPMAQVYQCVQERRASGFFSRYSNEIGKVLGTQLHSSLVCLVGRLVGRLVGCLSTRSRTVRRDDGARSQSHCRRVLRWHSTPRP